jgi:hypothetical protein
MPKATIEPIGLHHPLDGVTYPNYKLLCFLTDNFLQREEGASCYLAPFLWLILFNYAECRYVKCQLIVSRGA